jgi:hypothetical protein
MHEPTREWLMVCDLMPLEKDMTQKQRDFVKTLYEHLDPHESFLSQQSPMQLKWLTWIHDELYKKIDRDW